MSSIPPPPPPPPIPAIDINKINKKENIHQNNTQNKEENENLNEKTNINHIWENIFYKRGDKDTNWGLTKELRNPNLPYKNFHTLRHTAGTWILKKTNNLKITKEILGHADIRTSKVYAKVLNKSVEDAFEKLGGI